ARQRPARQRACAGRHRPAAGLPFRYRGAGDGTPRGRLLSLPPEPAHDRDAIQHAPPGAPAMRVLLADDEPLARERLRALLAELPGVELVGEAANGREAFELALQQHPDAVLLDIAMPVLDGLEAARYLM